MPEFLKRDEKKVEYVELIYDLIFVYVIGRNSSLISHIENGFISPNQYLTYCLCTLITIQIWFLSTLFINRYGNNSPSEYVGLFINMFLMYYIADGTRIVWQAYFYRYNIAWALILVNIGVQYYLKYRTVQKEKPWEAAGILSTIRIIAIQVLIIAVGILLYAPTGLPLTPLAMIFGMIAAVLARNKTDLTSADFSHLTERVMLYIVFTFGEMIIAISVYFGGGITPSGVYFSVMAFLVVVGLFMSYGFFYDHLLDREMNISGNTYMLFHIFIIFALSNITIAMEFMRESEIDPVAKSIYLVASFAVYYVFLFLTFPFTKVFRGQPKCLIPFLSALAVFAVLMMLFYDNPKISIALSVILTFTIWYLEHRYQRSA